MFRVCQVFICCQAELGMNVQAFFQRWWLTQNVVVQEKVRKLVDAGQLEFVYVPSYQLVFSTCKVVYAFAA